MTCTEARRQLPGPESEPSAQVVSHLQVCAPCRVEAESLLEIDRRLERMGAYQLLAMPALMLQMDREAATLLGTERPQQRRVPSRRLAAVAVLVLSLVLAVLGLVALLHHHHH